MDIDSVITVSEPLSLLDLAKVEFIIVYQR